MYSINTKELLNTIKLQSSISTQYQVLKYSLLIKCEKDRISFSLTNNHKYVKKVLNVSYLGAISCEFLIDITQFYECIKNFKSERVSLVVHKDKSTIEIYDNQIFYTLNCEYETSKYKIVEPVIDENVELNLTSEDFTLLFSKLNNIGVELDSICHFNLENDQIKINILNNTLFVHYKRYLKHNNQHQFTILYKTLIDIIKIIPVLDSDDVYIYITSIGIHIKNKRLHYFVSHAAKRFIEYNQYLEKLFVNFTETKISINDLYNAFNQVSVFKLDRVKRLSIENTDEKINPEDTSKKTEKIKIFSDSNYKGHAMVILPVQFNLRDVKLNFNNQDILSVCKKMKEFTRDALLRYDFDHKIVSVQYSDEYEKITFIISCI